MVLTPKQLKHLKRDVWYHATSIEGYRSIIDRGVLANYNKDHADALDFGYGFYLTTEKARAEAYIARLCRAGLSDPDNEMAIIGFSLDAVGLFEADDISTKIYDKFDDDFASFVLNNRLENVRGLRQHQYAAIFGGMTDSYPTKVVAEYRMGKISREEAVEAFKKGTSMKQLSLHDQAICDRLHIVEAYTYNINTEERKELTRNG